MAGAPEEQAEGPNPWRWAVLVVVCVLAGAVGGRLLVRGLPAGRVRYSADARLDRAARAVVERADAKGPTTLVQGKQPMALPPLAAYLDREQVVRLAAECAGLRRRVLAAIGADGPVDRRTLDVASLTVFERDRLCDFLKLDAQQAQLVLYALGWPYVGRKAEDWKPDSLPAPSALPPGLEDCLALARAAPAWPLAEQELRLKRGLTDAQTFAVRTELLHRALADAFNEPGGADAARQALGRYADLAAAQADAVLAMAGAQALARAGQAAVPALDVMARRHPALAQAVRGAPN